MSHLGYSRISALHHFEDARRRAQICRLIEGHPGKLEKCVSGPPPPPLLEERTAEILGELGYTAEEFERIKESEVV